MANEVGPLLRFRLDPRSGVPAYRQLFDQVANAVRLGVLEPGDQLPSVREVVTQITINPNTVHRAYRELETAGLAEGRPGLGTFVSARPAQPATPEPARRAEIYGELVEWVRRARQAGFHDGDIRELITGAMAADHLEEATIR